MTIRFNEPLESIDLSELIRLPFFDDGEDGEGSDEVEGDEGDGEGEGSGDSDGNDADETELPKKKSDREARYRTQLRKREKELEEAQARIKEFEDEDKSTNEKLADELEEEKKGRSSAEATVRSLRIQNAAIISASKYDFRDINDALKFAVDELDDDLSEDEIPDAVDEALKDLAKAKPYLLKGKSEQEDDDSEPTQPSGRQTNSRKSKGKLDEEALLKKFPALRR